MHHTTTSISPVVANKEGILEGRLTALRIVNEHLDAVCKIAGEVEVRLLGPRSAGEGEGQDTAPSSADLVAQLTDLTKMIKRRVSYVDESLTRIQDELGNVGNQSNS